MPAAVTVASLAKVKGAVGTVAPPTETTFEKVVLNPKAFLDSTLKA